MIVRRIFSSHAVSQWEHSFSGSPRSAEPLMAAVRRCAERHLGIFAATVKPLLPTLGNRAVTATGPVEIHPSYLVLSNETPQLDDGLESLWVHPLKLGLRARQSPHEYSPLLALHAEYLPFFGGAPRITPAAVLHEERATG